VVSFKGEVDWHSIHHLEHREAVLMNMDIVLLNSYKLHQRMVQLLNRHVSRVQHF